MAVLGLQSPGDGSKRDLPGLAASYVDALAAWTQGRRIHLLGWSMGGVIAQEMARQLEMSGMAPVSVTMIDSWMGARQGGEQRLEGELLLRNFLRDLIGGELPRDFDALTELSEADRPAFVVHTLRRTGGLTVSEDEFRTLLAEYQANYNALVSHQARVTATPVRLYRASRSMDFPLLAPFAVPEMANLQVIDWEGDHFSVVGRASLERIVMQSLGLADDARCAQPEDGVVLPAGKRVSDSDNSQLESTLQ
jgi:thioesterase domain-containing protein